MDKEFRILSQRNLLKGGYKESPSLGEEVLSALLLFAMGSSSDIHSNLPEAKLDLSDTKLSLLVLLGTPLVSLASTISALKLPLPIKLNLLWLSVAATFGCKRNDVPPPDAMSIPVKGFAKFNKVNWLSICFTFAAAP
jgi:hypothetical protein